MKAVPCQLCHEIKEVHCTDEQYQNWQDGMLIQQAMPDVPAEERDLLMSGICSECFDRIFPRSDYE